MSITASIIIPTHNRSASLKKMLESLELQSWPSQDFEVIVVADGCRDDTVAMLKNHKACFRLFFSELPGNGAAAARNQGAAMAKGRYFIFADDDMELSVDFIKEHLAAHSNENTVVIGYSPFKPASKASIQRMTLREWWEEKFQEMRRKDHRFRYNDLTSGNFSVSAELFKKLGGFDTSLLCREDYELGFRLIKAGAGFHFAYTAKAFHNDEATDLHRSLLRKKMEGMADLQIKKLHPDYQNKTAQFYLSQSPSYKRVLLRAIQYAPLLCDGVAGLAEIFMHYFERLKMIPSWVRTNRRLHQYWYLRGLMESAGSVKTLYQLIADTKPVLHENQKLTLDLQQGLKKAETDIDRSHPLELIVYFGEELVGTLHYDPGAEPVRGIHLRRILRDRFFNELASVIKPDIAIKTRLT